MRQYLRLFKSIAVINFSQAFTYRADSIWASFISSALWGGFNIFSMYLVTQKIHGAYGLTAGELILLSCIYNVIIGIFGVFFMKSLNEFPQIIDKGTLEYFLLKPVNSQLYISTHTFEVKHLTRIIIGILFIFVIAHIYAISLTVINTLLFFVMILVGIALLYACLFILNTIAIWSPGMNNINELFYSLRSIGRYPRDMFSQINIFIFAFVAPFVIFVATPAKVLLGKASVYEVAELILLAVIMLGISHLFWKFALKHYASASS